MGNADSVRIGKRIADLRRAEGLTRHELAKRAGITSELLKEYEEGARVVPASHLWDIAVAQDVPLIRYIEDYNEDRDK